MARYLTKAKALFLHIPRTGGSFIEDCIEACGVDYQRWLTAQPANLPRKHSLLAHYWPSRRAMIEQSFAFVRHPVALYESCWKWLHTISKAERRHVLLGKHWRWHPAAQSSVHYDKDFNVWVSRMLKHEQCWVTRLYEQYIGPEGGEFCFYIGRTESPWSQTKMGLLDCFIEVMELLGYGDRDLPLRQLEELEQSPWRRSVPLEIEWDASLREQVLQVEESVLRRFYGKNEWKRQYGIPTIDGVAIPSAVSSRTTAAVDT